MSNGKTRPTACLVLGIISIALGALCGCCGVFNMLGQVIPVSGVARPEIPADIQSTLTVLAAIGLALNVILIVSGIGLLLVKNWARILSMVYAVIYIPLTLLNTFITAKYVLPIVEKALPQTGSPEAMKFGIIAGIGIGLCFGLIYPITLLIVLNLKNVRAAFTSSATPPPAGSPQ